MLEGNNGSSARQPSTQQVTNQSRNQSGNADDDYEVEDVTDTDAVADQRYKAAMEDEYAKREGGA